MKTYAVITGPPMYNTHEVECEYIEEKESYTSFDDDKGTPVLMIPTSIILSIGLKDDAGDPQKH